MNYTWYNNKQIVTSTTKLGKNFSSGAVAYNSTIYDFGRISGTGKTISSILKVTLKRKYNDAYNDNFYIDYFDCHYQMNTLGSNEEYTK